MPISRTISIGAIAAAAVVGLAPAALAHHGWADYHEAEAQVSGTVVSANLGGPHGGLKVRNTQGLWDVVLAPPPAIERAGLTSNAVPVGATVTARGHRHKSRLEIKTERLVVGGKTYDLYPNRP